MQKFYNWDAKSSDDCFADKGTKFFSSKEDCYNDMRNAVLEKMKWNTEFKEDFDNDIHSVIDYKVEFSMDKIEHTSYSGVYTYTIHEFEKCDEIGNIALYHEELKDRDGGKLYLVFNDGFNPTLSLTYGVGDYFPLTIYECLTCRWVDENRVVYGSEAPIANKYLRIESADKFVPITINDEDYARLVKLNPFLDGVCLVSMTPNEIFAISLQDIRKKGIKMAITDSIHRFNERDRVLLGREWKWIGKIPTEKMKQMWKVVESWDEYTLWMNNEYGEMYLEWDGETYMCNI